MVGEQAEVVLGDIDRGVRWGRLQPSMWMMQSTSFGGLATQRIPRFDEPHVLGLAAPSTTDIKGHDQWYGRPAFAPLLL